MSAEKYKVGDRVVVKSLDWYNENKNTVGNVPVPCCFVREMSAYCGKVVTIRRVGYSGYLIEENFEYSWSDEMFEGLEDLAKAFAETGEVVYLPKNLKQCIDILGDDYSEDKDLIIKSDLDGIRKLVACRNAYWKMANDWKPDYTQMTKKYCIVMRRNRFAIITSTEIRRIFAFPTPEMARAYLENFRGSLEACKDWL